jgi:hypothetical protein
MLGLSNYDLRSSNYSGSVHVSIAPVQIDWSPERRHLIKQVRVGREDRHSSVSVVSMDNPTVTSVVIGHELLELVHKGILLSVFGVNVYHL